MNIWGLYIHNLKTSNLIKMVIAGTLPLRLFHLFDNFKYIGTDPFFALAARQELV